MSPPAAAGLPDALERAASELRDLADAIRPANGDPVRLLEELAPQGAARVLAWLLEHEPAAGAELADAWAEDAERGAPALLAVDAEALPKAGAKALRRARHRLRARGAAVPEEPVRRVVATLPRLEEELDHALVSGIDPRGARAVYLVTSHPSGGARVFEVLLDEVRGVLGLQVYATGRAKVRRFLRDGAREGRFAVPAPPAAVRALVRRVAAAQPPERPLPRGFSEWRSQVAGADEAAATPGELARAELAGEAEPAQLRRAAELVRSGEIGPWPPALEALEVSAQRISQAAEGVLIVGAAQRREQIQRAFDAELVGLFSGSFAEASARRFEETAFVLWKREREDDARACLAAATALRAGSPAENPVARAMLEGVLAPLLRKLEEGAAEAPGAERAPAGGGR